MMNDIMLDLETMDNVPTAAIVSIGAIECDLITGQLGQEFYRVVDLDNQKGTVGQSTAEWWGNQSDEAKIPLTTKDKVDVRVMCVQFYDWLHSLKVRPTNLRLWGNGASFDNAIIHQTFSYYDIEFPIPFWNDRDMRTIVGFYPRQLQEFWRRNNLRKGTHHNALDDAKHQVRYCSNILQELGVKELY